MKRFSMMLILLVIVLIIASQTGSAQWVSSNGPCGGLVSSFETTGKTIYVNGAAVFQSTDFGKTWSHPEFQPGGRPVTALQVSNSVICAKDAYKYYISTDAGTTWTVSDSTWPNKTMNDLLAFGNNIFISVGNKVYRAIDNGKTWAPLNIELSSSSSVNLLVAEDSMIFAAVTNGSLLKSVDTGSTWTALGINTGGSSISGLAFTDSCMFAGISSMSYGVYRSTTKGASWKAVNEGLNNEGPIAIAALGNTLFVGTYDGGAGNGVYRSTDNGTLWQPVNSGLPGNDDIRVLAVVDSTVFAGTVFNGVYISTDCGGNWTHATTNLTNARIDDISINTTRIFAATTAGLFYSDKNLIGWIEEPQPVSDTFMTAVCANGNRIYAGSRRGTLFQSTNNGTSWAGITTGFKANSEVRSIITVGSAIYSDAGSQGVTASIDNGVSWTRSASGLGDGAVFALATVGSTLFAASAQSGIYVARSEDGGATWDNVSTGLEGTDFVKAFAAHDSMLFAGGYYVFVSGNLGATWQKFGSGFKDIQALAGNDDFIFAGTRECGMFVSDIDSADWREINTGLPDSVAISSLAISDSVIYAGVEGFGVYHRRIAETTVSIAPAPPRAMFNREHFNISPIAQGSSGIMIKYSCGSSGRVVIAVFNLSGRKVATVVDKYLQPGNYACRWNSPKLTAGCYSIRLQEGPICNVRSIPIGF